MSKDEKTAFFRSVTSLPSPRHCLHALLTIYLTISRSTSQHGTDPDRILSASQADHQFARHFRREAQQGRIFPQPASLEAKLHPLDDPTYLPSNGLFQSRQRLVAALGMMTSAVQAPTERLMNASLAVSLYGHLLGTGLREAAQSTLL